MNIVFRFCFVGDIQYCIDLGMVSNCYLCQMEANAKNS